MKDKKLFATLMLLLATIIWGVSYSVQTFVSEYFGTFTIVFFKGIGGILLLYFIIKDNRKITYKSFIQGSLIGLTVFAGCVLQQRGMELSTVSKASFITSLYIVMVPIIEMFSGKTVKEKIWVAIIIALIGLYFLCFSGTFTLQIGDILLFLGSIMFAIQIVGIDRFTKNNDVIVISFFSQMTVAVLSFIVMLISEKLYINDVINNILPILFIVVISGVLAATLQTKYQKEIGASLASLILSLESVFGAIGGWLLLNQTLSVRERIGCVLLFIAILLAES